MDNLNNFKSIKEYLNTHATTANLSWEENKQKASVKILNYINDLVNEFKINDLNDSYEGKKRKLKNIQNIKNTFLYVLDMLQKSLNQGALQDFKNFDDIANNDALDKQLYLNLTGQSSNNSVPTDIKALSEKKSNTLLKNLKIIVTHKNTDGFWNNSNTKTNWFGKNKHNNRTKTHEDFVNFIKNDFYSSDKFFTNLLRGNTKNRLKYIGGVGHHSAKPIEKLIGLDEDYKYIKGFGVLDLGQNYNLAQIKGKFDKYGIPVSGQIKCHDENNSPMKNNIEFYKNPKDNKYYFKRIIKQGNNNLKIYLFKTNDFKNNLKLITGTINELQNIENNTPVFIGKKTINGYSGNLQLGEKCLTGDFDKKFNIIMLKEFGLNNNDSKIQVMNFFSSLKQKEVIKDHSVNNLYWFSQSTLFSSEDFQYLFNKLKNIKLNQSINNQHIKHKISDSCVSDYIGETSNKEPHGFGKINWSDSKDIFFGEFKNGHPVDGIIIKDKEVFHIKYTYNDKKEVTKVDEKNIDENSLNIFIESIYKEHREFIIKNYDNLKLESLLNLITQKPGFKNIASKFKFEDGNNNLSIIKKMHEKDQYALKILNIIESLRQNRLSNEEYKINMFNYIENTTNTGISHNYSYFAQQSSTRGRIIAWCAVFHTIKSKTPNNIKELEKFIKDIFQKNDFTFGRDRSEQYLNEYLKEESVKSYGGQLYNLKLIKNEAIKSSEFLLKKEYSEKETKSAEKIQKIFKLKSLYKKFVNNPSKTYKTFSNDKLANEMFGKHIATISTSDNQIKVLDYITTDQYLDYHRSAYSAKQQTFHTTNLRILSDPSKITTLGVTLSNWQGAIERTKNDRMQNTQTKDAEDILKQYAKTSQQILSSEELKKLKAISFYKFNFSLHAQEVHEMIIKVCNHIENNGLNNIQNENSNRIRDNIARLHMFLTMLVTLHNNNHIKFTAMLEPVIHELSILVYEITNINSTPFITHQEFNQAIKKEFLEENGTAKINKKYENISASGYTANSGMHAYTVGLYISKIILNNNDENKTLYSFKEYGKDHYYETENIANSLGIPKNDNSPNIHIVNGSVMNGFTPYTRGVDINKFIGNLLEEGMFRNNKHNIIVLDNTNANYDNLKLDDETQILIDKGLLTIVVWESWQKMGILGTDQAQYGRVVVLSSKSILEKKLDSINQEAEKDIIKLDMQIGALFQICRKQHNKYRELNFKNGETLRSKIGVNSSEMHQIGPFLVNNDIKKVLKVYKPAFIRDSFGFNFISIVGSRISAGTEANIDIKIFSSVLKKLIKNTADNQEKIICLNNLIYELNNYFSTLKINSLSDSKLEIIELMSYLSLVQMVIQYPRYYNLKNKLNNDNIIKICDQFLKEHNKKHYNKLIYKYLEGSKKSLSIIANLKLKLRKDN